MKKKEKQKDNFKTFISSYPFLYTVLILLFVIVLILGILVFIKGKEKNKKTMVISLLEEKNHSSLNIDLKELKGKEYILKITNYRDNNINQNDIDYSIIITNPSSSKLIITKEEDKENLAKDVNLTINEKLESKKKQEDIYHIRLDEKESPSKGDKITIEITN